MLLASSLGVWVLPKMGLPNYPANQAPAIRYIYLSRSVIFAKFLYSSVGSMCAFSLLVRDFFYNYSLKIWLTHGCTSTGRSLRTLAQANVRRHVYLQIVNYNPNL